MRRFFGRTPATRPAYLDEPTQPLGIIEAPFITKRIAAIDERLADPSTPPEIRDGLLDERHALRPTPAAELEIEQ